LAGFNPSPSVLRFAPIKQPYQRQYHGTYGDYDSGHLGLLVRSDRIWGSESENYEVASLQKMLPSKPENHSRSNDAKKKHNERGYRQCIESQTNKSLRHWPRIVRYSRVKKQKKFDWCPVAPMIF
jgi:hypothetical protein